MSARAPGPRGRPTLFADRDGTLIEEVGFLSDLARMRLLPGVAESVRAANRAGLAVVVVTNQSGVARGYFDEALVEAGGRRLAELLARQGARLDGHYFCPHHPEGRPPYNVTCSCRKPGTGLLERAAAELGLTLRGAHLVGDRASDLATGAALGVIPLLVRTGYGRRTETELPPDFHDRGGKVFDDFPQAVSWLLGGQGTRR